MGWAHWGLGSGPIGAWALGPLGLEPWAHWGLGPEPIGAWALGSRDVEHNQLDSFAKKEYNWLGASVVVLQSIIFPTKEYNPIKHNTSSRVYCKMAVYFFKCETSIFIWGIAS